jgi:pyruvate formate lyase activating enzyme
MIAIGGCTMLSTVDYPSLLSAVIYTKGCPWRCRYCHNPELQHNDGIGDLCWDSILSFLKRRAASKLLDAAVFSGGEPIMQDGIYEAIKQVKATGLKIGLHTSGYSPNRLRRVLPLVDWISISCKALPEDYPAVTGTNSYDKAWQSIELVIKSIDYLKYQICVIQDDLMTDNKLVLIRSRLKQIGVHHSSIVVRAADKPPI